MFYSINKREMKCRLYEDDIEVSVIDFNNAINRKRNLSILEMEYDN